jgi:hypothetical protein
MIVSFLKTVVHNGQRRTNLSEKPRCSVIHEISGVVKSTRVRETLKINVRATLKKPSEFVLRRAGMEKTPRGMAARSLLRAEA